MGEAYLVYAETGQLAPDIETRPVAVYTDPLAAEQAKRKLARQHDQVKIAMGAWAREVDDVLHRLTDQCVSVIDIDKHPDLQAVLKRRPQGNFYTEYRIVTVPLDVADVSDIPTTENSGEQ